MKKIIVIVMLSIILVGCSKPSQYMMVQNKEEKYGLLEMESKDTPKCMYDSYQKIEGMGYIVQKEEAYGYLTEEGKEVIKIGTYKKIVAVEKMLITYDKDDVITIFNGQGKKLYTQDKKTNIILSERPIIQKGKEYTVLDSQGEELLLSEKEIRYVSVLGPERILVGYKNNAEIVDVNTTMGTTVTLEGTYVCKDYSEKKGYLLYDIENKKIAYITTKDTIGFVVEQEIDDLYFDGNKNIVAKKDGKVLLFSKDGEPKQGFNSYYQDSKTYVNKNTEYIYGPHSFYNDGKETIVDGMQLDPLASYIKHNIFPVFIREKGYQFYTFEGKPAFETMYRNASAFDKNGRAIVSKDGKKYFLITTKNEEKSEKYNHIEYIGSLFYAAYTTENKFDVIDTDGNVLLDTYFLGNKSIVTYKDVNYGIFDKNGKSYVYDMTTYEMIFSCEGDVVLHEEGYFVNNDKVYYTMKGEKIYSR